MARKSIKRELSNKAQDNLAISQSSEDQQIAPVSSGDTILIDSDVNMIDEGYETNHHSKTTNLTKPVTVNHLSARSHPNVEPQDAEDGLQVLGRGVKKLVQAVQALRHLGVEDLDLPLPKIVVVGDQSTGKSSLIEGISEIKVPRSAGTCTRCPLEINITESSARWTCTVSLSKKYVYEGNHGSGRALGKTATKFECATRARPLGPWSLQDPEDFHFATFSNKDDVSSILHLAQLATLNPGTSHERYLPGSPHIKGDHQVKFSPNVVRLDISGPGLPNLSLFDLPGVINVSEIAEEAYLVDLVKNLVKMYIEKENCINLLALPMSDDLHNSSASRLIRENKVEFRTLGCLTKPDRLQQIEDLEQWVQVLNGQRFQLGYRYHVVMNNPDVNVSHSIARKEECTFFSHQEPWATTLNPYATQFGTLKLQTILSQKLTGQIRKSLPRIMEQLQEKADEVEARLKELPEPLEGNLALGVMAELLQFERLLQQQFDGGHSTNLFQKEWNVVGLELRRCLAETRPVLTFSTSRYSQAPMANSVDGTPTPVLRKSAPIAIDSDDSDEQGNHKQSPTQVQRIAQKRPHNSTYVTPRKLQRTDLESPVGRKADGVSSKRFSLDEIHSILQDAYIGLHNLIDPKAIEKMIKLSMEHWERPLDEFLTRSRTLCEDIVFQQVQEVYSKYSETRYYETLRQICETFFEKTFSEHRQMVQRVLKWEMSKPKTCNDEAIDLAQARALTLLQIKRREIRAAAYLDEQEAKIGKFSVGQARVEKIGKITDGQLGPDPYKKEIEAMSTVKAYYECAYFRFVDVVCASVQCDFFIKCRDDIVTEMKNIFALTDPDAEERLGKLLEANPAQEARRTQLKKEKVTIAKAQERLEGLTVDE